MENRIAIKFLDEFVLLQFKNCRIPHFIFSQYEPHPEKIKPTFIYNTIVEKSKSQSYLYFKKDDTHILGHSLIRFSVNKIFQSDFITSHLDNKEFNQGIYLSYLRYLRQSGKGINLHSSGIKTKDNIGILFTGPSNSGKSTIARLSPYPAFLNDDENIIIKDGEYKILSSDNYRVIKRKGPIRYEEIRLSKIFFLKKDTSNLIIPLKRSKVLVQLVKNIPHFHPSEINPIMNFSLNLIKKIPCYELRFKLNFNFDKSFILFLCNE